MSNLNKRGVGDVYRSLSSASVDVIDNLGGAISHTASACSNVALAGNYMSKGLVVDSKVAILEKYREVLIEFGVSLEGKTPLQIITEAEVILSF